MIGSQCPLKSEGYTPHLDFRISWSWRPYDVQGTVWKVDQKLGIIFDIKESVRPQVRSSLHRGLGLQRWPEFGRWIPHLEVKLGERWERYYVVDGASMASGTGLLLVSNWDTNWAAVWIQIRPQIRSYYLAGEDLNDIPYWLYFDGNENQMSRN